MDNIAHPLVKTPPGFDYFIAHRPRRAGGAYPRWRRPPRHERRVEVIRAPNTGETPVLRRIDLPLHL